jgi:hypothetical protein
MAYATILQLIHSHKYLLDKQRMQKLMHYWKPAKQEYHAAQQLVRKHSGGMILTPCLDALQQHVQDVLKKI